MRNFAAEMKERTRRLTAALLLAVFAAFACGNTMFTHSHVGADGGVVTHSHPYLPSAHHTHSATQLLTLTAFNGIAFDGAATGQGSFIPPVPVCREASRMTEAPRLYSAEMSARSLRAPPAVA